MSRSNQKPDTDILMKALQDDPYEKGDCDFSTTQLLKPPQMTALAAKHKPRPLPTYAKWRSFVGTALHDTLEKVGKKHFPSAIIEERLFWNFEIEGKTYTLGGKSDVIFPGHLIDDYKVLLTAGCPDKVKPDHYWQNQFNAYLARKNGISLTHWRSTYILDDWRHTSYKKGGPQEPRREFTGELMKNEEIEPILLAKLTDHVKASQGQARPCTDEERWKQEDVWRIGKNGFKRARKKCYSLAEVDEHKKPDDEVRFEQGRYTRCEDWCEYSHVCPQFKNSKK
jgi:hypothetical protein